MNKINRKVAAYREQGQLVVVYELRQSSYRHGLQPVLMSNEQLVLLLLRNGQRVLSTRFVPIDLHLQRPMWRTTRLSI